MIPIKINNFSWRVLAMEEGENSQNMAVALDFLAETREEARIREAAMKKKATGKYDSKVRPRKMQEGDLVLKSRIGS